MGHTPHRTTSGRSVVFAAGLWTGRCDLPAWRARQGELQLAAALAQGVAIEAEEPSGPQLVAPRHRKDMREQGTLEQGEGVTVDPPRPRGSQLVDERWNCTADQARQR